MLELNKVYNMDCIEFMKTLPDKCIDLVLTDPPYGMSYERHISDKKHSKIINDDNLGRLPDVISELYRITTENMNMYIFCSWHNVDIFKKSLENCFSIRDMLIWNKGGMGMGDLSTTYGGVYEICFYVNKKPQKLNGSRDSNIMNYSRTGNILHPTEKPVIMFKYLLEKSSKEGDIVLDCFAGSGTTGVACKELGRNYILVEKEPKYIEIINRRLENTTVSLFH